MGTKVASQVANTRFPDAAYTVIIAESTRADQFQAEEKQFYAEEAALLATKWLTERDTIPAAEVSRSFMPIKLGSPYPLENIVFP